MVNILNRIETSQEKIHIKINFSFKSYKTKDVHKILKPDTRRDKVSTTDIVTLISVWMIVLFDKRVFS